MNIHLEKSKEMPIPKPILEQDISSFGEISTSMSKNAQESTLKLNFPMQAMGIDEPFAAALVAMPAWWQEWLLAYLGR